MANETGKKALEFLLDVIHQNQSILLDVYDQSSDKIAKRVLMDQMDSNSKAMDIINVALKEPTVN